MALKDFLFPDETICYQSSSKVKYLNEKFDFYITSHRYIIFQNTRRNRIFAERFKDIGSIRYSERGRFMREAHITLETNEKYKMALTGNTTCIREIWREIQKKSHEIEPKEVGCKFCGAKIRADSIICSTCNKILK